VQPLPRGNSDLQNTIRAFALRLLFGHWWQRHGLYDKDNVGARASSSRTPIGNKEEKTMSDEQEPFQKKITNMGHQAVEELINRPNAKAFIVASMLDDGTVLFSSQASTIDLAWIRHQMSGFIEALRTGNARAPNVKELKF